MIFTSDVTFVLTADGEPERRKLFNRKKGFHAVEGFLS